MRERLSSRLGFILLSAGCAIGIGNVWRFPYVTGQSGGGWFVLLYLFFLALLGVPVLVMEFACGRAAQCSIAKVHETLTPERRGWRIHGLAGFLGCFCLLMFYSTVAGWMVLYFFKTAAGSFAGLSPAGVEARFTAMLANPWEQAVAMAATCLSAVAVCAVGVQKGLERVSKWMMLALLLLIGALAWNSVTLDGAARGLRFFMVPDFAKMKAAGVVTVLVNAMNQAFFTLSIGIGSMTIFGSYVDKSRTLLGEAVNVTVLDTVVAVCAGLIIIPACFAYGVEPGQGPGLVFVTLPNVFNHMPLGRLWGTLFFLFMSFAALTTLLAVFENIVACFVDYTGWGRRKACVAMGAALCVLSLPCVFGFNVWSGFRPLGPGSNILDLEDFIVSNLLLPLGALTFVLYCSHRRGWGWESFMKEANSGEGPRVPAFMRGYYRYVLPAVIVFVFAVGIVRRFWG